MPAGRAEFDLGWLEDVTFAQLPAKMAVLGMDALVTATRGGTVSSLIDPGAALVTPQTIGPFK